MGIILLNKIIDQSNKKLILKCLSDKVHNITIQYLNIFLDKLKIVIVLIMNYKI